MNDQELARHITSLQARMNRMETLMQQLLTIQTTSGEHTDGRHQPGNGSTAGAARDGSYSPGVAIRQQNKGHPALPQPLWRWFERGPGRPRRNVGKSGAETEASSRLYIGGVREASSPG